MMRRSALVAVSHARRRLCTHSLVSPNPNPNPNPNHNPNVNPYPNPVPLLNCNKNKKKPGDEHRAPPLIYKALFLDAMGTLILPSQSEAKMYREIGLKYGVRYSEDEISARYNQVYAQPRDRTRLRYEGDARPFWNHIIEQSTGCSNPAYSEELYQYYTKAEAWELAEPGLAKFFTALRESGIKTAIVSNFDTRLRPLLHALQCYDWFDAIVVSAEVGAEKPNPQIFWAACDFLGVQPIDAVHVGDGKCNDVRGARDAGCNAWLWGEDVCSYLEVARKIGVKLT